MLENTYREMCNEPDADSAENLVRRLPPAWAPASLAPAWPQPQPGKSQPAKRSHPPPTRAYPRSPAAHPVAQSILGLTLALTLTLTLTRASWV